MINDRYALASEIKELEAILESIPQENAIERLTFSDRLKSAKKILEILPPDESRQTISLTFRGEPVIGSHGVAADFGSKAAGAFADAFAAILAGLNNRLSGMGPIPDKIKNQLLITGTAVGSFGFEFELPRVEDELPDFFSETSRVDEAIEKTQALLRVSAEGTDDEVTELVDAVHPRAVKKVAEFLGILSQQQALCGLEFKNQFFQYHDIDQLKISVERLSEKNIKERDEEYTGEFQGVLPQGRTFEFKTIGEGKVIRGKVDIGIEDADILNREWLHKPVRVTFNVIQVGKGKPRFSFSNMLDIKPIPS